MQAEVDQALEIESKLSAQIKALKETKMHPSVKLTKQMKLEEELAAVKAH